MRNDASRLIRTLWQYCNVLRDDGLSYPDYVEQLTYLLFLKMSDEQNSSHVPEEFGWRSFASKDAAALHRHYSNALSVLGQQDGMLGLIFRDARNKIRDPAKLRLLIVDLIGQTDWSGLSDDVKGDAYEGLLEKNARDTKSGAGQYFTSRPLIDAIVACVDPRPGEVICDPACGTGGFLLGAHRHISATHPDLNAAQRRHLRTKAIRGVELVPEVARLAAMNLLLHGIGGATNDDLPVDCRDSLQSKPSTKVDVVLTNPPFGIKGSVTYSRDQRSVRSTDELTIVRPDFWVQTSNKQLNFVQHVASLLRPGGRAAVVVPDNVLFESGAASTVRRLLLETCDVHTILRLPTGIFYAQGVQANVLFFDRPAAGAAVLESRRLSVYDLRLGQRFSLKTRPLMAADLEDFKRLYIKRPKRAQPHQHSGASKWRSFAVRDLLNSTDVRLDLTLSDGTTASQGGAARLDELSVAIADDLRKAMDQVAQITSRAKR